MRFDSIVHAAVLYIYVCVHVQASAVPVRISGATGDKASLVNGVFEPKAGELHNGHAVYYKAGEPDTCLRYCKDWTWAVSRIADKEANNNTCYAHSVKTGLKLPNDGSSWKVCVDDKLVKQPIQWTTLTAEVHACVLAVCEAFCHVYVCVHDYMCVCVCVCMRVYVYVCLCVCLCVYVCLCVEGREVVLWACADCCHLAPTSPCHIVLCVRTGPAMTSVLRLLDHACLCLCLAGRDSIHGGKAHARRESCGTHLSLTALCHCEASFSIPIVTPTAYVMSDI